LGEKWWVGEKDGKRGYVPSPTVSKFLRVIDMQLN
jgi:hypothetical protein